MIDASKKIRGIMRNRGIKMPDLADILSRKTGEIYTPDRAKKFIAQKSPKGAKLLLLADIFQVDPLEFGDQVTVALAERGLEKKRAAEMMGMSVANFVNLAGRIRRGQGVQSPRLVMLSQVTGKPVAYFLPGGANGKR